VHAPHLLDVEVLPVLRVLTLAGKTEAQSRRASLGTPPQSHHHDACYLTLAEARTRRSTPATASSTPTGTTSPITVVDAEQHPYRSWPSPPPTSRNPHADCLGVINDAAEFALWLSPHILSNVARVLSEVLGLDGKHIDDYLQVLIDLAAASGGGLTDPPQTVGDCPDWEDNRILDLAAEVGAFVIVSADIDLPQMSPWRGRPIVEASQFASLVDASRRARRRSR
jgi:predicted nucleic acid-binding protein